MPPVGETPIAVAPTRRGQHHTAGDACGYRLRVGQLALGCFLPPDAIATSRTGRTGGLRRHLDWPYGRRSEDMSNFFRSWCQQRSPAGEGICEFTSEFRPHPKDSARRLVEVRLSERALLNQSEHELLDRWADRLDQIKGHAVASRLIRMHDANQRVQAGDRTADAGLELAVGVQHVQERMRRRCCKPGPTCDRRRAWPERPPGSRDPVLVLPHEGECDLREPGPLRSGRLGLEPISPVDDASAI